MNVVRSNGVGRSTKVGAARIGRRRSVHALSPPKTKDKRRNTGGKATMVLTIALRSSSRDEDELLKEMQRIHAATCLRMNGCTSCTPTETIGFRSGKDIEDLHGHLTCMIDQNRKGTLASHPRQSLAVVLPPINHRISHGIDVKKNELGLCLSLLLRQQPSSTAVLSCPATNVGSPRSSVSCHAPCLSVCRGRHLFYPRPPSPFSPSTPDHIRAAHRVRSLTMSLMNLEQWK